MGDQYQSRYHCQEGAPSESGRACKSEGVSGQAGGLSCSETSLVGGVEFPLGITGGSGGAGRVGGVSSAENESASSIRSNGLRFVSSDGTR